MGVLAVLNAYSMRVCLSIAITEMTVSHKANSTNSTDNTCPILDEDRKSDESSSNSKRYDWSEEMQVRDERFFFYSQINRNNLGNIEGWCSRNG